MASDQVNKLRDAKSPLVTRTQDNAAALLNQVGSDVNKTPIGGAAPPGWIPAELQNSLVWSVTTFPQPAHHVDALQYVHARGYARNPLVAASPAGGNVLRFPPRARPSKNLIFPTFYTVAGAVVNLIVQPDGWMISDAIAAGASIFWHFEFLAEQ